MCHEGSAWELRYDLGESDYIQLFDASYLAIFPNAFCGDWLDNVEHVGVKRRFWDLQESCRVKCRLVLDAVAEAVQLSDALVKQDNECGAQAALNVFSVTQPVVETKNVLLLANLKKACEKAVSTKAKFDVLRAATEPATEEYDAAFAKVRKEQWEEFEAWKATTLLSEVNLSKVREETSAEVNKLRLERESAAACHREVFAFNRRFVKTREERKD